MKRSVIFGLVLIIASSVACGQEVSNTEHCKIQKLAADIELATSVRELAGLQKTSNAPDTISFFAAYRTFQIKKSSANAAALLKVIPKTEQEEMTRYSISGHDCFGLSEKEDNALDSQYDELSPLLGQAILLAPQFMNRYVSYSLFATMDVHSDYTQQMVPVCQRFHPQFMSAVSSLSEKDRKWMRRHLFNPERCTNLNMQEE
jgi:hypothetical protein